VDDYDMKITHVIRAEEHLSNTPRQVFMIDGLGYPRPEYAHIPFVAAPGGKRKLSKREIAEYLKNHEFKKIYEHGQAIAQQVGLAITPETFNPVIVDFYRQVGYLPDAIVNYLMLLGWAHEDGKSEFFTRQEMAHIFTLDRVNKAAASFDTKKLFAFQERYFLTEQKVNLVLPYLQKAKLLPLPCLDADRTRLRAIVQAAGDRLKVAGDILNYAHFFQPAEQLVYDDKDFEKSLRKAPDSVNLLRLFKDKLAIAEPFDAPSLEKLTLEFVNSQNSELKKLIHALRVAVSGRAIGFGLYDTLAILGKPQCLARIERALARM
jgi:glutamyl-tRNA synthetase